VVRAKLLRQSLEAPAIGLSLQATSVTKAQHLQLGLETSLGLDTDLSTDPRDMTLLIAELAADVGLESVGVLVEHDSPLLEKSSALASIQGIHEPSAFQRCAGSQALLAMDPSTPSLQLPTRILPSPIELAAVLRENELVVLQQRAFVIGSIQFDQRLEAIEWWESAPISRDYFRVWLAALSGPLSARESRGQRESAAREGIEALVYVDRSTGKSYIQALYD
jgi:hypothetical protein